MIVRTVNPPFNFKTCGVARHLSLPKEGTLFCELRNNRHILCQIKKIFTNFAHFRNAEFPNMVHGQNFCQTQFRKLKIQYSCIINWSAAYPLSIVMRHVCVWIHHLQISRLGLNMARILDWLYFHSHPAALSFEIQNLLILCCHRMASVSGHMALTTLCFCDVSGTQSQGCG